MAARRITRMPNAKKIRAELQRVGSEYAAAQKALEKTEGELAKWLALAQESDEVTVSEAAELAKLSSRPVVYKILRRAGSA